MLLEVFLKLNSMILSFQCEINGGRRGGGEIIIAPKVGATLIGQKCMMSKLMISEDWV